MKELELWKKDFVIVIALVETVDIPTYRRIGAEKALSGVWLSCGEHVDRCELSAR
jgi:hypothetical protein